MYDYIGKSLLGHFFGYIRYLALTPVIISFFGTMALAIVGLVDLFSPDQGSQIKLAIPVVPSTFSIDNGRVLALYGWASLIFYLLSLILQRIFGPQIILSSKQKVFLFSLTYLVFWTIAFMVYLPTKVPGATTFLVGLAFLLFTAVSGLIYLAVSALIKLVFEKVLAE